MNYALILDNNQYQFVKLITTEKKHSVVQLFEQTTDKKIKNDNLMLSFTSDPRDFAPELQQLRTEIDLPFLWELAEEQAQWTLDNLTNLYFGSHELIQKLALLLAISEPAIYFSALGEQNFKRCGSEEIAMRQLQIQRQQEYQAKFDALYEQLYNLQKPDWKIDPINLINKPDKNSLEYKVVSKVTKD